MTTELTTKAKQTRENIVNTSVSLFVARGYEATTMRDIAKAAHCSLGLAYRYFPSKGHLVLDLYDRVAKEFDDNSDSIPAGTLAERFEAAMLLKFRLLAPYRALMGAIVGVVMSPDSGVAVLGEEAMDVRIRTEQTFARIVDGSRDAPKGEQAAQLSDLLYAGHLLMILFWVTDKTPETAATTEMLAFAREMLSFVRPMLMLPPASRLLTRLVAAMAPVFKATATESIGSGY